MFLDYFALGLLIFVALVIFYGIIVIHDIPYEIAKEREHPHQDAIHYAGWVSLFTLHALWPFLWIWATLWRKERGWGGFKQLEQETHDIHHRLEELIDEVNELKNEVSMLKQQKIQKGL
ncbi:GTPase [Vibrio sp. JCM 18905]|nr:GTPase [Vibrio sp. JCM 18905]